MVEHVIFDRLLTQWGKNKLTNLVFDSSLSDEQLEQLTQYINSNPGKLAFLNLSLHVDRAMLQNGHYQSLLNALQKTGLHKLNMAFSVDELNSSAGEIAKLLNECVAVRANYPVIICEQSSSFKPYADKEFSSFNATVISNVQRHNQVRLLGTADQQPPLIAEQPLEHNNIVIADEFAKKIKLKALIKHAGAGLEHIDQYIKLEVQHNEVEEQVQEQIIDVEVQAEQHEHSFYDGQLVDFSLFSQEPYSNRINSDSLLGAFKYELFGNLPKAIKFLSHEAALNIAENAGAFAALNADNLPQNFMLKRTAQGEMVLDYDSDADKQQTNVFTPKKISGYSAEEFIYEQVDLPESVKTRAENYFIDPSSKQLDNLWVRYGSQGVEFFLNALGEPGDLSTFMIKHYFNRFPHWDRFLDDHRFLDSLEKIKHYSPAELSCLMEFLSSTDDTTQFDLKDTLNGFDAFWREWSELANKNKLDLNELDGRWAHRKVGNPLVYMERLLTILKNSRDLTEQLVCLDGLDLVLCNVGNTPLQQLEERLDMHKRCTLVQQGNTFYLYGNKADGSGWGFTLLDAELIAAERLPFPLEANGHNLSKYAEQPFNVNHKQMYQYIDDIGAHNVGYSLDNYGAYYASKYENFHIVSKEMGLYYDPDRQNAWAFNANSSVYYTDLERLMEYDVVSSNYNPNPSPSALTKEDALVIKDQLYLCSENPLILFSQNELTPAEMSAQALLSSSAKLIPYNGQNIEYPYKLYKCTAIPDKDKGTYIYAFMPEEGPQNPEPYDEVLGGKLTPQQILERAYRFLGQQLKGMPVTVYARKVNQLLDFRGISETTARTILNGLLFVAHERSTEKDNVDLRLDSLSHVTEGNQFISMINRSLMNLFQQDIRLNSREGKAIMDSWSTGSQNRAMTLDKNYYLQKLVSHLQNNKYATIKAIQYLQGKSFVYALDTTDYFMKNAEIAAYYQTALPLFSAMINSHENEPYYEGRADEHTNKINQNMEGVKAFLFKACTETQPNNLDHAIKTIIQSGEGFSFTKFLAACQEIDTLPVFDYKAVAVILAKHQFTITVVLPDLFSRKQDRMENFVLNLLCRLEVAAVIDKKIDDWYTVYPAEEADITEINVQIGQLKKKHRSEKSSEQLALDLLSTMSLENTNDATLLLDLDYRLKRKQLDRELYPHIQAKKAELYQLSPEERLNRFRLVWETKSELISEKGMKSLHRDLTSLKYYIINEEFRALGNSEFITQLSEKIHALPSFNDPANFENMDIIINEVQTLAAKFKLIINSKYFIANEKALIQVFSTIDYADYDYGTLFVLLDKLTSISERDYVEVLEKYLQISKEYTCQEKIDLINEIKELYDNNVPSNYIVRLVSLIPELSQQDPFSLFRQINRAFQHDNADPLLQWMLTTDKLDSQLLLQISSLTQNMTTNRAAVHSLFVMMSAGKAPILHHAVTATLNYPGDAPKKIIELLALSYKATSHALKKNSVNYIQLITKLGELSDENLDALHSKIGNSPVAITCLAHGLNNRKPEQSFAEFIDELEKAPFGARDLTAQFNIEHVKRVVNRFTDLNSQSAYSHSYRKQMMEAFLFVNRAGSDLPVYYNKPAKNLSNDEIKQLFTAIKSGEFKHLDPFQTRLYALGLMREAMYRTTNQFPYSTQMLSLIDCMMHKGDVISNIDTGQGKSMIDTMKATLLWLESGRVDLTTASLIDAKRDLDQYSPFWSFLGVPFAKTPISSVTPFDAYEQQGINVGTMAQFALFYSKAKAEQVNLESEQVSLVMNESDYTILDDRTVYRYAASGGPGLIGSGKEWIYDEVNEFVVKPNFKAFATSEAQDIAALRTHLLEQAKLKNKSTSFIEKLSDKKLLMLLESAIIVNFALKENFDYVLTKDPEPKLINGVVCQTRSAKIIMKDGKVSTDTQYGNGMQQLLYSKLNKINGNNDFVIEPESKTILSSNNKNMIDYYRSKKGFIWGSSGTVGAGKEIDLQYQRYGFEFSKVEPHQRNRIKLNKPIISANEEVQFKHITKLLNPGKNTAPSLVIFKDIATATRFHIYLQDQCINKTQEMQLYTGFGDEAGTVRKAAMSGMITITTPALGRNTDIKYDKAVGMNVIETFVASSREDRQKAGRTGRQGSIGNVYYSLNQTDFGKRSIDEVRAQLEEKAEIERQFNEGLYDALGGLLRLIGQKDRAFFKEQWSEFSEQVESKYRAEKQDGTYNRDEFLDDIILSFNTLTQQSITVQQLKKSIGELLEITEKETADKDDIVLSDCISADLIAYHFVNPVGIDNDAPLYLESEVKAKLTELFTSVNTKTFTNVNKDYLAYLNAGTTSMTVIKKAHEAFLSEYLETQVTQSKSSPFYKRWLGFEGSLNKVVDDANYLLLFKAMVNVNGKDKMNIDIKTSIITLLEEYTERSWFVSKSKRTAANTLIAEIRTADNMEQVVQLLSIGMTNVMAQDCNINQHSFWRKIKPVNASGDSRLLNTLDRALKLSSVLTSQNIEDKFIKQVEQQSEEADKANAKVVTKIYKSTMEYNRLNSSGDGMKGRQHQLDDDGDEPACDKPSNAME